jgi:predicted phage gp36 major capsid-like protein
MGDGENLSISNQLGIERTSQNMSQSMAVENAAYLVEKLGDWMQTTCGGLYVTGTGDQKATGWHAEQAGIRPGF